MVSFRVSGVNQLEGASKGHMRTGMTARGGQYTLKKPHLTLYRAHYGAGITLILPYPAPGRMTILEESKGLFKQ